MNKKLTSKQITGIYILRSATYILLLAFIVLTQTQYIERKEGYHIYRCQYYDQYDNIVFANIVNGTCPTIDVIEQSETFFEFQTTTSLAYSETSYALIGLGLTSTRDYGNGVSALLKTHTKITYDNNKQVTKYETMYFAESTYFKDGQTLHDYVANHRIVQMIYNTEYFEQTEAHAFTKKLEQVRKVEEFTLFSMEDYYTKKIYTEKVKKDEYILKKESTTIYPTKYYDVGTILTHKETPKQWSWVYLENLNESETEETFIYEQTYLQDAYGEYLQNISRVGQTIFFDLDYSKRHSEDSFYYTYISGINYDTKETISNHTFKNILDGETVYTTGVHFFTIKETEYGKIVTRLLPNNYRLFGEYQTNNLLYSSNSMYKHLYDFEYQITRTNMLDPYYISKPFPLLQ